jgi:hypothetical protein
MKKYIWLIVLLIPLWVASEYDAPRWVVLLLLGIFMLYAGTLPSQYDRPGEGGLSPFLILIAIAGLVMGTVLFKYARALM